MSVFDNDDMSSNQASFYVTVDRSAIDQVRATDPLLAMALRVAVGMLAKHSPANIGHVVVAGARVGRNAVGTPLDLCSYMVRWNFQNQVQPTMELVPYKEEGSRRGLLVRFQVSTTEPSGWEYGSHEFTHVVVH
jgi:hypothetical protein